MKKYMKCCITFNIILNCNDYLIPKISVLKSSSDDKTLEINSSDFKEDLISNNIQGEGSEIYRTILESNHKCFLLKSAGDIKSIRRIQNLVIFTYFSALKFKYEQMEIQCKTLKILIRLDKPEDTEQIMSLLFETDPCALLFKLLQNHIIILDCNSKCEKIMDLENAHLHAYLLCELIKPTANENQENDYYPLPFIYPMYMLRFKKKM